MATPMTVDELKTELDRLEKLAKNGDLFALLGVAESASDSEIKEAYRGYARKLHGDLWSSVDLGDDQARLQRVFASLSRAHQTLSNAERKERYLAERRMREKGVPTEVEAILRAEAEFKAGVRFFERGDLVHAKARFEEAVKLHPTEPEYRVYRAWTAYAALDGDTETTGAERVAALATLQNTLDRLLKENESCAPAHLFMGHLMRTQGKAHDAKRHYETVLRLQPRNMEAEACLRRMRKTGQVKPVGGAGSKAAPASGGGFFSRIFGKG